MSSPPEFQILKLALSTVNEPEIVSLASGSDYEAEALLNVSTQVKIIKGLRSRVLPLYRRRPSIGTLTSLHLYSGGLAGS